MDPNQFKHKIAGRSKIQEARRKELEGYWFYLRLTDAWARVRIWSIADRAMFNKLPQSVQGILAEELDRRGKGTKARGSSEILTRLNDLLGEQETLANEFVKIGFMEPRVVLSEDDLVEGDDGVILASDLHMEERLEYLAMVLDGEVAAARKLRPFRSGPVEPVSGQPGDEAAPETERVPGPAEFVL
jgi:hypothetical protein